MEPIEIAASQGRDVYVELRLSTSKGSRVAITVGVSDQATDESISRTIEQAQITLEVMCEKYNRLDDLYPVIRENE